MGLMNQDMYLAGSGGLGQGMNAFGQNFMDAYKTMEALKIQREYKAMQEQLMQAQMAEMQRKQAAQEEIANLLKPQELPLMQNGQPTAIGNKMLQGMIGNVPQQISQYSAGNAPDQEQISQIDNPAFLKAKEDALAKLTEQGSVSIPKKITMDDLVRVAASSGQVGEVVKALIAAQQKASDVPSSKWKAFALGYKDKLLKENPNLTDGEINYLTAQEADRLGIDKNITQFIQKSAEQDRINREKGFFSWNDAAKKQAFVFNAITGEPPVSARGFGATDRQDYAKEYSQWQVDSGLKPQDIAVMRADYKSGDMALKNMTKQEYPMQAFVGNINLQISKLRDIMTRIDRSGFRLLDLGKRELAVKAQGSGDEAVLASYLIEVSNEIGKLSSGSSASVQQLTDSARQEWMKVHDPNLSPKELMTVLNATREQANMRLVTWKEAKQGVRDSIRGIGKGNAPDTYDSIINEKATKYGIDPNLIKAVIQQESNFNPRARSSKDARGLMQLMPETAKRMKVNNPYDPEENIEGGVRYLKELSVLYDGDREKMLAHYNGGTRGVKNPKPETRNYVPGVFNKQRAIEELARRRRAGG